MKYNTFSNDKKQNSKCFVQIILLDFGYPTKVILYVCAWWEAIEWMLCVCNNECTCMMRSNGVSLSIRKWNDKIWLFYVEWKAFEYL